MTLTQNTQFDYAGAKLIFEPMENTIKLLREFEVDIPDKSLQYMEKLGEKW